MTNPKDAIGLTKPALRLVPPALALHVSTAMADGAKKYGAYNWRKNAVRSTVYVEAALRHLYSYLDGEDRARDSGHLHLAHVGACMAILLDALEYGNLIDDRADPGPAADIIDRLTPPPAATVEKKTRGVYEVDIVMTMNGKPFDGFESISYSTKGDVPPGNYVSKERAAENVEAGGIVALHRGTLELVTDYVESDPPSSVDEEEDGRDPCPSSRAPDSGPMSGGPVESEDVPIPYVPTHPAPRGIRVGDILFSGPPNPRSLRTSYYVTKIAKLGTGANEITAFYSEETGPCCLKTASLIGWEHADGAPLKNEVLGEDEAMPPTSRSPVCGAV